MKGACTLHLSRCHGDRWGSTDIATLSLHLILFSASLRMLRNFNPVHSEIKFSQRFFCRPLLLPPCTGCMRNTVHQMVLTKRTTYEQSINYIYGHSLPVSTHVFSEDYVLKTELI